MIIMKKFYKRDSHGHHGSKRRELAQHILTWIARIHSHSYINTVTTTWCEALAQLLFFSACWVFSCVRNPPNSDMDLGYRIFIVRM